MRNIGVPARDFRRSATLYFEVAKGSKPTIWTEARRDAPRGNAPARLEKCSTVTGKADNEHAS